MMKVIICLFWPVFILIGGKRHISQWLTNNHDFTQQTLRKLTSVFFTPFYYPRMLMIGTKQSPFPLHYCPMRSTFHSHVLCKKKFPLSSQQLFFILNISSPVCVIYKENGLMFSVKSVKRPTWWTCSLQIFTYFHHHHHLNLCKWCKKRIWCSKNNMS